MLLCIQEIKCAINANNTIGITLATAITDTIDIINNGAIPITISITSTDILLLQLRLIVLLLVILLVILLVRLRLL